MQKRKTERACHRPVKCDIHDAVNVDNRVVIATKWSLVHRLSAEMHSSLLLSTLVVLSATQHGLSSTVTSLPPTPGDVTGLILPIPGGVAGSLLPIPGEIT